MKGQSDNFWNERYAAAEYVYGTLPNGFFKEQLDNLKPAKILLPAEGEGRNAVYAASQGWEVDAFDSSESGRKKALELAEKHHVKFDYQMSDVLDYQNDEQFDVLALIYAHFPANVRTAAHQHLMKFLKPGGTVIFEAFAKEQLGNTSGGPKNIDMLFSSEEVKKEFSALQFELLQPKTLFLEEGEFQKRKADVIRFVGTKI